MAVTKPTFPRPAGMEPWAKWGQDLVQVLTRFASQHNEPLTPGTLEAIPFTVAPAGWLLCNGAVVERSDYPNLFRAVGISFNTGGETGTQFRLPNGAPFTGGSWTIKT